MPGIINLKPVFKNQIPIGIKRIVQHKSNPIPNAPKPSGTEINNHKHADNNAPVSLNPSQSNIDKTHKLMKKPII